MTWDQTLEAVAIAAWEITTSNGTALHPDLWDEHMQNVLAIANNTYTEGMGETEWLTLTIQRLS